MQGDLIVPWALFLLVTALASISITTATRIAAARATATAAFALARIRLSFYDLHQSLLRCTLWKTLI